MNSALSTKVLAKTRLLYQLRSASTGYWNKDWQPLKKLPATDKEKAAAAKKYNLLPEEYKTYKEDELVIQCGDYPKLPDVSDCNKDVYYPWDIVDSRRNFGEPMHMNAIMYTEDRIDTHIDEKLKYSRLKMFASLVCAVSLVAGTLWLTDDYRFFPPIAARHMPKEGVVHYRYD